MEVLLKAGASAEVPDKDGVTALFLAAGDNDPATLQVLLAGGANPATRNSAGRTALEVATAASHAEVVKILADVTPSQSASSSSSSTPASASNSKKKSNV